MTVLESVSLSELAAALVAMLGALAAFIRYVARQRERELKHATELQLRDNERETLFNRMVEELREENRDSKAVAAKALDEIDKLRTDANTDRQTIAILQSTVHDYDARFNKQADQIRQLKQDIAKLTDEKDVLVRKLGAANDALAASEKEYRAERQKMSVELATLRAKSEAYGEFIDLARSFYESGESKQPAPEAREGQDSRAEK